MEIQKINLERLKAANFPRCDMEAIHMKLKAIGKADRRAIQALENHRHEIIKHINNYLKVFAAPPETLDNEGKLQFIRCLNCDHALTGLFGSFEYGIRHGEGACSKCGYPGRANHYIEHEGFKLSFVRVLQYHPSQLKRK